MLQACEELLEVCVLIDGQLVSVHGDHLQDSGLHPLAGILQVVGVEVQELG